MSSGLRRWLWANVSARAMRAPPTGPMIEPLLVTLNAFPTKEMFGTVWSDELNHMISDSITTLAALDCLLFGHLVYFES